MGLMSCRLWSEMYRSLCASVSRPGFANIYSASVCAFCLYRSVSAGCINSTAIYESSFSSRLSVLAIFLGGAVFSPSGCSCSRFLAAFWWSKKETRLTNHEPQNRGYLPSKIIQFAPTFSSGTLTVFKAFTFLSHCWWRYRSRMFVFSVTMTEER